MKIGNPFMMSHLILACCLICVNRTKRVQWSLLGYCARGLTNSKVLLNHLEAWHNMVLYKHFRTLFSDLLCGLNLHLNHLIL